MYIEQKLNFHVILHQAINRSACLTLFKSFFFSHLVNDHIFTEQNIEITFLGVTRHQPDLNNHAARSAS